MPPSKHCYRHFLSLLHKHKTCNRPVRQIHSRFIVAGAGELALWNSVLKHYSLGESPQDAIFLFKHLRVRANPMPLDSFTYSYLIKACANTNRAGLGTQIRCLTTKAGFDDHVHVQTAVVNMYMDCGCLVEAKKVFDEMPQRNLVTWNVLFTGFIKWGEIGFARSVFDAMPERNVVSWTGLIDGYTRVNQFQEALFLFREMLREGIKLKPTEVTLLAVFPSIWNTGCLELCESFHAYGEKTGLNIMDVRVMNCLMDAYSRSGSIESAQRVFEEISDEKKNLISWSSIVSGFAMHGMAMEASEYYSRMENKGVKPNGVTFLSLLHACSHGGLVEEGLGFFKKMVDECKISPGIKHYGTLIDMLGRAGRLEEAEKIAIGIPDEIGNAVVWRTLLGSCSFHGDVKVGERVSRKIMELEREYGGDYVLMSNIFCGAGRFEESERMRRVMDETNACKVPGITSV